MTTPLLPTSSQQYARIGGSTPVTIGPWTGGLHNSGGAGEGISDEELYGMVNLELDVDKSLANRPAIIDFPLSGFPAGTDQIRVIGTYLPDDGRKFLVVTVGNTVFLVNPTSGAVAFSQGTKTKAVVQYDNKLWVIPQILGAGGFISAPTSTTLSWTGSPIPSGDAAVVYKDRLFVSAGFASTSLPMSRVFYSAVADFNTWPGINNFDVVPGNGQHVVTMVVTATDILIFKENQTWKFGYGSDVAKASLDLVDAKIGAPSAGSVAQWNNNTVYVMHDNAVYELYSGSYTRISDNLKLDMTVDVSLYSDCLYGLTIHRDRLFCRYYGKQYVMSLKLQRWSEWQTAKKFTRIVVIPGNQIGLDVAYASSAANTKAGQMWFFTDDRIDRVGLGSGEIFDCSITTKLYDFAVPTYYKRIHFGGLQIATSGDTTVKAIVPSLTIEPSWDDWEAQYTWDSIEAQGVTWDTSADLVASSVVRPPSSSFSRRVLKCLKKFRFRQVKFDITTVALTNSETNASVRIYDLTVHLAQAETIVKVSS